MAWAVVIFLGTHMCVYCRVLCHKLKRKDELSEEQSKSPFLKVMHEDKIEDRYCTVFYGSKFL